MASTVEHSLFAALWVEELAPLSHALEQAMRRRAHRHLRFDTFPDSFGYGYDLTLCGLSTAERNGSPLPSAVVADRKKTMGAELDASGGVEAGSTERGVIGVLAIEYVMADIPGSFLIDDLGEVCLHQLCVDPGAIDALLRA